MLIVMKKKLANRYSAFTTLKLNLNLSECHTSLKRFKCLTKSKTKKKNTYFRATKIIN